MTAVNFAYWLQGYLEIGDPQTLSEREVEVVKRHLNMVFVHDIDPKMGDQAHQSKLNTIHNSKNNGDYEHLGIGLSEKAVHEMKISPDKTSDEENWRC